MNERALQLLFWLIVCLPFLVGLYVWGAPPADTPSYRPLLLRGFSYFGLCSLAIFLLAAVLPIEPDSRPTARSLLLGAATLSLFISMGMAYEKEDCRLAPFWGCLRGTSYQSQIEHLRPGSDVP